MRDMYFKNFIWCFWDREQAASASVRTNMDLPRGRH
jgi:hypothetical protein